MIRENRTIVMKFGGTSVQDADAISKVVEIVRNARADGKRCVVVVSALGGVTNRLQAGIERAAAGDPAYHREVAEELWQRHEQVARALTASPGTLLEEISRLFVEYTRFGDSVYVLGEATARALDYTMGLGERASARLVAEALRVADIPAQAIDATGIIVTDDCYQQATPLLKPTRERVTQVLPPLLEAGITPVVTGDIGATASGVSTTLGRGGSDYSASLIGAMLNCDEVWIWTDVDGVMTADPRIVPDARTIEVLTHGEVSELAYFGAKVLHPRTIRPLIEANIPLRVKNTFNPTHPGTLITANGNGNARPLKAVTAIRDVSQITVAGKGMLGVPGIAARTFAAVAQTGTNVLMISQSSSEQSICFIIPQSRAPVVVAALNEQFAQELARRDIDSVTADDNVTIITMVGERVRQTAGVAGQVFSAVGARGINLLAIAQGSSDSSLSVVVAADDADAALRAIHELIVNSK